jgi:hypothetical protein
LAHIHFFEELAIIEASEMMRPTFLALVAAASIAGIGSAQGGSDLEREGLVGRVSIVRAEYVHAIRAEGGYKQDGQPRPLGNVTYDEAGNYAVRDVIDDYGFPVRKETFAYTKGRLTGARLVDPTIQRVSGGRLGAWVFDSLN